MVGGRQVLEGLDHQPDGRPGRPRRDHVADPPEEGGRAGDVRGAGQRAAAVARLDGIPVDHDDVGHERGVRVGGVAEVGDVAEQGDDRVVRVGGMEGVVHGPDLAGRDPDPGRLLDRQVAEERRMVLDRVHERGDA